MGFVCLLTVFSCVSASAQETISSEQTNQKIQELAGFARAKPVDIPIGVGDLVHVDVFDVPELSRDVRVSDTGDIGFANMCCFRDGRYCWA